MAAGRTEKHGDIQRAVGLWALQFVSAQQSADVDEIHLPSAIVRRINAHEFAIASGARHNFFRRNPGRIDPRSRENCLHHLAMHVREPEAAALK